MTDRVTLTPKEAAHTLGVSVTWLYKEMGRGHLPTLSFGRRRLIHKDDLNTFVASNRHAVHVPVERPVDKALRRRPVRVA